MRVNLVHKNLAIFLHSVNVGVWDLDPEVYHHTLALHACNYSVQTSGTSGTIIQIAACDSLAITKYLI